MESGFILDTVFLKFLGAGGLDAFSTVTALFAVVRDVSDLLAVVGAGP
jgi:hypothetical protein